MLDPSEQQKHLDIMVAREPYLTALCAIRPKLTRQEWAIEAATIGDVVRAYGDFQLAGSADDNEGEAP